MENKISAYERYKDTNAIWLRKIPEHWRQSKAKRLFKETSVKNYPNEELLSATQNKGVIPRRLLETRVVMPTGNLDTFKLVEEGNFVISLRSFQGGLEYSKFRGIVSPAYTVLNDISNQNAIYWKYLFKTVPFIYELQRNVTGIRQGKNIDVKDFKEIILPIPTLEEQDQIAKYLDYNIAKINKFIKAKKKQIELLKEKKQAIINNAVTKGINPDVKMKPSRIEWLGDMPENWRTLRVKNILTNTAINTTCRKYDEIYIGMENIEGWTGRIVNISDDVTFEGQAKQFQSGDILFGKLRPYLAKVRLTAEKGVCSGEFLVLRNITINYNRYLEFMLRSKSIINAINSSTFGARMPRADWEFIGNLKIVLPEVSEQKNIVQYLDKTINSIDKAINKIQKEAELIEEYKTRLIADIVTGKVDVRNIEISDVSEDYFETEEEPEEPTEELIENEEE